MLRNERQQIKAHFNLQPLTPKLNCNDTFLIKCIISAVNILFYNYNSHWTAAKHPFKDFYSIFISY